MFSHATQQMDPKQSDSQPVSAERGRSSSTEKGKRSGSRPKRLHCFRFLKGTCDAGDACRWLHLTEEEIKVKEMQQQTKSDSLAAVEVSNEVALPCIAFDSDDDQDDGCHFAGVCPEVCAAFMDDDDRMFIGRRHPKSKITAFRNLLMPDEFTESRTKDLREEIR